MPGVPWVADRRVLRELGARAEAVLREPRLAEGRRPDRLEHAGEVAVGSRGLGDEGPGAVLRGQTPDVAVVLDEAGLAREEAVVGHPGLGERLGEPVGRQPVELDVELAGALDGRRDNLATRDAAGADLLREADGVVVTQGVVDEGVDSLRTVRRHGGQRNPDAAPRRAGLSAT